MSDRGHTEPLVTCVNTCTQLNDNGIGMLLEKRLGLLVDEVCPNTATHLRHGGFLEFREVIVELLEYLHGRFVV